MESIGPCFYDALQLGFAECQQAILDTVKREFRGTVRSGLESMKPMISRALHEIQGRIADESIVLDYPANDKKGSELVSVQDDIDTGSFPNGS
jgi:hypothetical protein